jgi:hypothetical protein
VSRMVRLRKVVFLFAALRFAVRLRKAVLRRKAVALDSEVSAAKGSTVYSDYIAEQVAREDARQKSFEARATAVVTTSGVLATLLLGFTTLTKPASTGKVAGRFVLPPASHDWVRRALVAFAVAAILALLANLPLWYWRPYVKPLKERIERHWKDSFEKAEEEVARTRIKVLRSARLNNDIKGYLAFAAIASEVAAVVFIARAVWLAL